MVNPIPHEVLIHEVTYEEYLGEDRFGEAYGPPVTLGKVLVQPVSSIKRSSTSEEEAFSSLLFFDCVNSFPSEVKFKKLSKITFNGEEMTVNKINPIYAFRLHHYELELI